MQSLFLKQYDIILQCVPCVLLCKIVLRAVSYFSKCGLLPSRNSMLFKGKHLKKYLYVIVSKVVYVS